MKNIKARLSGPSLKVCEPSPFIVSNQRFVSHSPDLFRSWMKSKQATGQQGLGMDSLDIPAIRSDNEYYPKVQCKKSKFEI